MLLKVEGPAERAAGPREHPGAAARVARQPALPVLREIREARRRAAEGAHAAAPRVQASKCARASAKNRVRTGRRAATARKPRLSTESRVRSGSQPAPSRPGAGRRSRRVMLPASQSSAKVLERVDVDARGPEGVEGRAEQPAPARRSEPRAGPGRVAARPCSTTRRHSSAGQGRGWRTASLRHSAQASSSGSHGASVSRKLARRSRSARHSSSRAWSTGRSPEADAVR